MKINYKIPSETEILESQLGHFTGYYDGKEQVWDPRAKPKMQRHFVDARTGKKVELPNILEAEQLLAEKVIREIKQEGF